MKRLPKLDIRGKAFVDEAGRHVLLRGVNLGGDCKVPYPDGGTDRPSQFDDHRTVSFVGRPFPLDQADEHLGRIAHWGFNVVRLLTTWEAVEHAGPGRYDEDYLDYFAEVCRRCGEHGLYVFVDFHQDVWSRMTGGDGAPGWTFEAVGLDFTRFHAAGAAHIMQAKYDYSRGGRQDAYPQMSWGLNDRLPATAIMWTLFFGGRHFMPRLRIDGRNVQDYLQDHYLGAMRQVARRLEDQSHVLGFDTLNEPGRGLIGRELEYRHEASTPEHSEPVRVGPSPSTIDVLLMARGIPRAVPNFARESLLAMRKTGEITLNRHGVSIWRDGTPCPFEAEGIYRLKNGSAEVLRPDHFLRIDGRAVNVERDCVMPFFHRVAQTIRSVREQWLVFAEVNPFMARHGFPPGAPARCVNASHWYDIALLLSKKFDYDGLVRANGRMDAAPAAALRERYVKELSVIAAAGDTLSANGAPALIGEFGIPYDLDEDAAYAAWAAGDRSATPWIKHTVALRLMYDALDRLLLNSTQWNYTASNLNAASCGDRWNQEDLSIFSRDQQSDPHDLDSGGRAIAGFCRPYARSIQGTATRMLFDETGCFTLEYEADPTVGLPTEIFVPKIQYPHGYTIVSSNGTAQRSEGGTRVWVTAEAAGPSTVRIEKSSSPLP